MYVTLFGLIIRNTTSWIVSSNLTRRLALGCRPQVCSAQIQLGRQQGRFKIVLISIWWNHENINSGHQPFPPPRWVVSTFVSFLFVLTSQKRCFCYAKKTDLGTFCTSLGCHVTTEVYESIYLFNIYSTIACYLATIIKFYFRLK